jgi:hypothetical protein
MRADEFVKLYGGDLVGRWVTTEAVGQCVGSLAKILELNPDPHAPEFVLLVYHMTYDCKMCVSHYEQISFLDDPFEEWALWLNEYMDRDNPREWLQWVLDSVPEERRLLTALALSVAHWHPAAKPRGGYRAECLLCLYYRDNCVQCDCYKICRSVYNYWVDEVEYYGSNDTISEAADAVFEDLKALYADEWRRMR